MPFESSELHGILWKLLQLLARSRSHRRFKDTLTDVASCVGTNEPNNKRTNRRSNSSPQDVNKTFPRDPESPDCARESKQKCLGSWESAPGHSRKLQGGPRDRLKGPKTALGYSRNHDSYPVGPEGRPGRVHEGLQKPPVSLSTAVEDQK